MKKLLQFPRNFYWGAATASYQIEGGIYNNDWAKWAVETGRVPHAGESSDHYALYEYDFNIAKFLGHNCSRISIEWSRIEPEEGVFDAHEIEHYRRVLTAMKQRGLTPFVTLWHFTLPIWFAEKGGFVNKKSPEIFARYCQYVVSELGDLCENWTTINEPEVYIAAGYLRKIWPPFKKNIFKFFKVHKNLAKAHNLAYQKIKSIDSVFEVSIVCDLIYFSAGKNLLSQTIKKFSDWFWNKMFLKKLGKNFDAIGLNYYFHKQIVLNKKNKKNFDKSDMGWDLDPKGLYYVLSDLKKYNKPIYVTEAGIADRDDKYRAQYIKDLVQATHQAISNGADVRGFMYWSILDNFEWAHGYGQKFGLVSFDAKTQERQIRDSAYIYKNICEDNGFEVELR